MTALIKWIVIQWSSTKMIEESDEDVYVYGLEVIIHTLINLTAILVSAAFIGKIPESLTLLAVILPLQSYGGGYHAKTYLRCFLITYIGWWVSILLLPIVPPVAATAMIGVSILVVCRLAPVPNINVKMSEGQRLKMRKYVRITVTFAAALSVLMLWSISERIGMAMSVGLGIIAISMLAANWKNLLYTQRV